MTSGDAAPQDEYEVIGDVRDRVREIKRNRPATEAPEHRAHAGMETVREDTYRGHHIVIRTTYRIEVDGRPITGHIGVANDGRVHYHALPNVSFNSAIDVIRRLIDAFPDEFEEAGDGHHDGHH